MLEKLKNLFSKKADKNDFNRSRNPNFITESSKIIKVLEEIKANSILCSIQIDGTRGHYSSSIINIEHNIIVLDELIPKEGNILLQEKKALKLSTFHQGLQLAFNLSYIKAGMSGGVTYYKAPLPERVFYPQRRKSPRVKISSISISFTGIAQGGALVKGYISDLSQDGASININFPANKDPIERGDKIKSCQIVFEKFTLSFDFIVHIVKRTTGSSKLQMGGSFENLSKKNQTKLADFITSVERIELRKRKD